MCTGSTSVFLGSAILDFFLCESEDEIWETRCPDGCTTQTHHYARIVGGTYDMRVCVCKIPTKVLAAVCVVCNVHIRNKAGNRLPLEMQKQKQDADADAHNTRCFSRSVQIKSIVIIIIISIGVLSYSHISEQMLPVVCCLSAQTLAGFVCGSHKRSAYYNSVCAKSDALNGPNTDEYHHRIVGPKCGHETTVALIDTHFPDPDTNKVFSKTKNVQHDLRILGTRPG